MHEKRTPSRPPSPAYDAAQVIAQMAELAGGLAHELRNPLSTMMVNLKLLAEDLQDLQVNTEDVRRRALLKVDVLRREADRLQGLFDDFLNVVGPCRLQRESIDLREIVRYIAEFVGPHARSRKVVLDTDLPPAEVRCPVDEKLLRQALLNLVLNAQEAMPEGGILRVLVGVDEGEGTIAVSDSGVGIAPEDRERILRPFFSTKARGSGLGLSITQRIVQEHGGSLRCESEPGKGTTFTIRLPLEVDCSES